MNVLVGPGSTPLHQIKEMRMPGKLEAPPSKQRIVMLIDDKPVDTLIEANPKGIAHFEALRDLLHALFETVPRDRLPAPVVEAMSRLPDIGPTLNAYYRPDNKREDVESALR